MLAPPALLNRAARYLQAAAAMVRDDGVLRGGFDPTRAPQHAGTFETDVIALRCCSDGAWPDHRALVVHVFGKARIPQAPWATPAPDRISPLLMILLFARCLLVCPGYRPSATGTTRHETEAKSAQTGTNRHREH